MQSLIKKKQAIKPHYKHRLLLSLLFFSLPIGITNATSVKQESYKTEKSNINDLDDQKEPDETSIESIDREKNNINDLDDKKEPDEPTIESIKQEKKTDKLSFDIEKLKGFISTAIEEVEKSETKLQNNEMVYFYGNTGSGKSTIINYLLGNELEKYYPQDEIKAPQHSGNPNNTHYQSDDESEETIYIEDSDDDEDTNFQLRRKNPTAIGPKIGQNTVQAETTYPCPYFPQNQQIGYCDTAGFSDTRGTENIVCSYIGNNLIIQKSHKLKAICFLTTKDALNVSRAQPFLNSVISTISNLIKETKDCNPLDSIFVVVNNKDQIKNKKLVKQVFNMLNNFRKGFEHNKENDQQNAQKHQVYINILTKILKESSNKETMRILSINPLDDGESRKAFLDRISKSPIIPKQNLKKLASKKGEKTVKYLQEDMLQKTEPIINRILEIQNTINEKTKKASKLARQVQDLNKDKENTQKENDQIKIEKETERIKIKKEQEQLNQKIIKAKQQREEIQKQIDELGGQKTSSDDNLEDMTKNKTEQVSKLENQQKNIKATITKLKESIQFTKYELDKLTSQINNQIKQVEQLKKEKNILIHNLTQKRIVAFAEKNKNWFDYYQSLLTPISDWADTNHEPNIFNNLKQNIYNAFTACKSPFLTLNNHTNSVNSVRFNPSGTLLASGSEDSTIRIWDTRTWNCIKTLKGHDHIVYSVDFNPSGTLLASSASGLWDNRDSVKVWNTRTWNCTKTLTPHKHIIVSVNFNPSGTSLVSCALGFEDNRETIKSWDTGGWDAIPNLTQDINSVLAVNFNPSGTLLASASEDKTIKIWNTSNGRCIKTLQGHLYYARSLHFNPSGTLLASASWDYTIKIWDTRTWQCIKTLQGHSYFVNSAHFNPSGTLLASGSADKTVKIWDTRTWQCIKTLKGHSNWVRSVHFNPSGTLLASGADDNIIKIWDVKAILDGNKTHDSLLDKGEFKRQTDTHIKKIKEIITHYYDTKIKKLMEAPLQKEAKILKDNIESLKKDLFTQQENELTLDQQIKVENNNINILDIEKNKEFEELEKIEEQLKQIQSKKDKNDRILQDLTQKRQILNSTIQNLEQSKDQKEKDLHSISLQLIQAQKKHEHLVNEIEIIEDNYQEVSYDCKTQEQELKKYQSMLHKKQPGIDLILKIDSIVPMGLIAYTFIKKYMQCKTNNKNNKHM